VTAAARWVGIDDVALAAYADELARALGAERGRFSAPGPPPEWVVGAPESRTGLVLALSAVNFGSGWHPVLRKERGLSGARTVAAGLTRWWTAAGGLRPAELADLDAPTVAAVVGQDPHGPAGDLVELFADGLRDLGRWVQDRHGGSWSAVVAAAGGSAARLAGALAALPQWDDRARHPVAGEVWLYKRAQLAVADLALAGVADFADVGRLTLMADNLVPHVLRLDGVLGIDPELLERIERGELLEAGDPEEVELRAVSVTAVERLVAALAERGRPTTAADIDRRLWWRGRLPRFKARPRHRTRCTWY
jgi:hypothetical protein